MNNITSLRLDTISVDELIQEGYSIIAQQEEKLKQKVNLDNRITLMESELEEMEKELDTYLRASTLIGTVSDDNTKNTLNKITLVINKALKVLYPNEVIDVFIEQEMYRNMYPHFKVTLEIDGKKRTFKQNGTGLSQIVSFLFTVALIDSRGGRKIMVMDELLNGLHPDAKYIIKGLVEALSDRFQFVVVEYGLDIGSQYVIKKENGTSSAEEYIGNSYYRDVEIENVNKSNKQK